jgi:hypothetical protein
MRLSGASSRLKFHMKCLSCPCCGNGIPYGCGENVHDLHPCSSLELCGLFQREPSGLHLENGMFVSAVSLMRISNDSKGGYGRREGTGLAVMPSKHGRRSKILQG